MNQSQLDPSDSPYIEQSNPVTSVAALTEARNSSSGDPTPAVTGPPPTLPPSQNVESSADADRFWDRLLHFTRQKRVIPVVGQDLLQIQVGEETLPLYQWLAREAAARLKIQQNGTSKLTLNDVACACNDKVGLRIAIDELLSQARPAVVMEPLIKLTQIRPFNLFLSTTFDPFLYEAARLRHERVFDRAYGFPDWGSEDLEEDLKDARKGLDLPDGGAVAERPTVYRLFGKHNGFCAITDEDVLEYVHSLQMNHLQPERLFGELCNDSNLLLLIGVRFQGWLARFFIRTLKAKKRLWLVREKEGFLADEAVHEDPTLLPFLQYFSTGTNVYSSGNPIEFVNELSKKCQDHGWLQESKDPIVSKDHDALPPGSVFLSYASEDVDVVRTLHQELNERGLDNYFDKEELQHRGGAVWREEIRASIEQSSVFIPIISRSVLVEHRREFIREWNIALETLQQTPKDSDGRTAQFLVPVVIEPNNSILKEPKLREFEKLQAFCLPGGHVTEEFCELIARLQRRFRASLPIRR